MKLSDIGKPNPKEMEFIDPYTNEPTGIFLTVHSLKSKIGKYATIEMQRKQLEARNNPDNLDENGALSIEVQKELTYEWVADLVESWKGVVDEHEKPIKPSKEAFIEGFRESQELLDAVFVFVNNSGNFGAKQEPTL